MLCCVRNVAWIMDSFERLVRRNAFEPSRLFATADERATVYSRTEALAHRDRVVGFAYSALKEAYYGEHSDHLLLIDYDILTRKPEACLRLVYRFLGEDVVPARLRPASSTTRRSSTAARRAGPAPRLRPGARTRPRQTVLPPDLFERFDQLTFWNDPRGTAAWRIAPEPASAPTGDERQRVPVDMAKKNGRR